MAKEFSFTPVSTEDEKPSFFTPAQTAEGEEDRSFLGDLQRKAKIAASGYASGVGGLPVDIIQTVLGAPSAAKAATTKLGLTGEFTPEQQQYAETVGAIPGGSEYLYGVGGVNPEPESGLERYIKTISQRAGGGGAAGAAAGPAGIGIGSAIGGGFGAVEQTLKEFGVPDEYIGPLMLALGVGSAVTPMPKFSKATKPSGLKTRKFEKVKEPTKVSAGRHEKITSAVEQDFREIGSEILSENKTYRELQDNPTLKNDVINMFDKVETLASEIKEPIDVGDIQKSFNKRVKERPKKGYLPSEFEEHFDSRVQDINKKFKKAAGVESNSPEVVDQFRKNNTELGELFEPGKSGASNRAKKEALLEHNRAIEDVIKQKFPDSEFSKLFEKSNKYWSDLMDIDSIHEFQDSIFKGKINYKQASKILDDKSVQRPFKKLLGKEGFDAFKQLHTDLLSTEKSYSLLKKARQAGFSELADTAAAHMISPEAGAIVIAGKAGKRAYRMLLDKPQIAVEWESAISKLKRGKFQEAEQSFKKVDELSNQSYTKATQK